MGAEFDNATAEEDEDEEEGEEEGKIEESEEENAAADDSTFGQFLQGISNPKEEFPEDGEEEGGDVPYKYKEPSRQEAEEYRTDKEVVVTKREMDDLLRDLDKSHPALKVQVNCKRLPRHKPNMKTGEGMR